MKLLIISNMSHYNRSGQIVGWGPTIQEIDALATIFDEITHIGCLYETAGPHSSLPYQSKNIRFIPLQPTGGESIIDKLNIVKHAPQYLQVIKQWIPWADVLHVRCPANIPLIALFVLAFSSSPQYRWVKYAGNWHPTGKESWSYTLQRWILQNNFHHGVVTVNGKWGNQPRHVYSFFNPCLTQEERVYGNAVAQQKILKPPYRILFVGRLESTKGVGRILEICENLHQKGIPFKLDLVGDGPERHKFEQQALDLRIDAVTDFHGWLPRPSLRQFYADAHFIVFPSSSSEGWPKVLSEAMAYGVIPIASNVSSIPQILQDIHSGFAFPPGAISQYVQAILNLVNDPSAWTAMSQAAVRTSGNYTYDHYLLAVQAMMQKAWNLDLHPIETIK